MTASTARPAAPDRARPRPQREGEVWAPVAILAPTGRDGAVAGRVLADAGFAPRVCTDITELCAAVHTDVGALLVTEESLRGDATAALLRALDAQPSWSDVPLVVLTGEGELSRALSPALEAVTAHANVTLLERPVRVATLVTTLRSALRARRRQLDVRDHLEERRAAEESLRESESRLRVARQQAEDASKAKSDFLAVMSHELRTPLNAIGGYTELMALGIRGPVTGQQQEDLERIQRSQRHLLGLINGVLNFARLEGNAVHYDITAVSLDEVLATCEALTAPQVRAKRLRLDFAGCPPTLAARADREKVQQIVLNLLSNAVKFTEPGGSVRIECAATGDGTVAIHVCDTGRGIPAEQLERVFQPFVQVDASLARTQEGVGLGLAISRDLARGMGGDLTVTSTLGGGSVFTLTLPVG
jgi:signal transduction histidine kinase